MSVLKRNRKASQFEVFHHLNKLRRDITDLLLRDFGYSFEKAEKRLERRFSGRSYEELTEMEKGVYDRLKKRWEAFDEWFIEDQRKIIVDCLRDITKEVYIAYAIETLPVNVNTYTQFGDAIQTEINLIKGWRKSDNKFHRAISDSASNFANVNNNGNANYNNASNANGVRPDFDSAVK